jgi:anti-sigma regulatory factor (Ser/Thr protein kinase)
MQVMAPALEHALPKSMDAPAMAREAIRTLEGQVPTDLVEDATLLVSELVTNGVKYGGEGALKIEIDYEGDRLRAEIIDQGSGFEPRTRANRRMELHDEGGWGLHLVETLADEWGVHEGSTHVWFEIRRD